MFKILIIGDGFIGYNLYKYFYIKYNTFITTKTILDVTDNNNVYQFLKNHNFTHIIYAAGIKNTKLCEEQKAATIEVNALAILRILRQIQPNIRFIYISTDYVFDGLKGLYTELDQTNPSTFYGKSKVIGESLALYLHENTTVVRTSGVYGKMSPWMNWLISELDQHHTIQCYTNVINSPTYALNLAEMIDDVCMHNSYNGIINLNGPALNRYELYLSVAKQYNKNTDLLIPTNDTLSSFPKNISLDNSKYVSITNKLPNNITNGLHRLLDYEN